MRIRFLTSTPLDIRQGSGTYVGIHVLARALTGLGHTVEFATPHLHFPVYTAERIWFNWSLRPSKDCDLTVGFDMDGYRIARAPHHVASLKGVIADEVRYEAGMTRFTMGVQSRCERKHVNRASKVLVTSRYSGERAQEFYGLQQAPAVVPEPIELAVWRKLLAENEARDSRFTVLFVGRFYRRKRVDILLRAAAELRSRIPELEVRIVGAGPCGEAWRRLAAELKLENTVTWMGDVSRSQLASEFRRADVFCLPSVQEGFGIVLLEAMAAGKPIVAARAAAIPEVAPYALLFPPDDAGALAEGLADLYRAPERLWALGHSGTKWVEQFDAARVGKLFLAAVTAR